MIIKPKNPYRGYSSEVVAIVGCQYRAGKDGRWLDNAIAGWSGIWTRDVKEPHSHSEIMFLKPIRSSRVEDGWFAVEQPVLVFSADTRGGDGFVGTRFEEASIVLRHPERWDLLMKMVPESEAWEMFERALKIENKHYAYVNLVLHYFLPLGWLGNIVGKLADIWYCSQAVLYCLIGKKMRISPRRLTRWYGQNGWNKLGDKQKEQLLRGISDIAERAGKGRQVKK